MGRPFFEVKCRVGEKRKVADPSQMIFLENFLRRPQAFHSMCSNSLLILNEEKTYNETVVKECCSHHSN
jgi:hypothetical protein